MGSIYGVGEVDEESSSLRHKLASDPQYSKLIAYAFLVFVLLYMPCMAAMTVFLRESGSSKELLFQISYTLGLAWAMAFVIYQGGKLLGL
jgi:ferrous iron transport protein B